MGTTALTRTITIGLLAAMATTLSAQVVARSKLATVPIEALPSSAVALHARLAPVLSASARAWVQSEARAIAGQNLSADAIVAVVRRDAAARFAGQSSARSLSGTAASRGTASPGSPYDKAIQNMGVGEGDIEAMAFIVLMQATNDADKDLKAIMAEVKSTNDGTKAKHDALNEMSDAMSLRLQMMMDRRSKLMSTLSNVMKKISTTQETLIQNLK